MAPLLGEKQVLAEVLESAGGNSSTVGVLASSHRPEVPGSSDSWQAAVLVYSSDDNSTSTLTHDVTVTLKGLPALAGGLDRIQFRVFSQILQAVSCQP